MIKNPKLFILFYLIRTLAYEMMSSSYLQQFFLI